MKKTAFILFLIMFLELVAGILTQNTIAASNTDISVYLNGKLLQFDQAPLIENGRTLVPVRTIAEELGSFVEWDEKTQTVIIQRGLETAVFKIGENKAYAKKTRNLDVSIKIVNGRTLIPLRALTEIFGARVEWNGETKTVNITCDEYSEDDLLKDFKNYGFYKFDYYRESFSDEHINNPLFPWVRVFSEIGEWGTRITIMPWSSYEKECYKEVIELILNSSSLTEITHDVKKVPSWHSDIISAIKYGLELDLDNLKKKAKKDDSDIENLEFAIKNYGRIKKLIKWSNFTLEEVDYLFTDYSHNIKYLNTILYAINPSESSAELEKAVLSLIDDYTNKWSGIVKDGGKELINFLKSTAQKAARKELNFGSASLYDITTFAVETIMNITGATKYADSVENAMIISMLSSRLIFKFDEMSTLFYEPANNKIKTNHSDQWDEYVVLFDITKASIIEMYNCMADVTKNSTERIYLERQIKIMKSIKISGKLPDSADGIFYVDNQEATSDYPKSDYTDLISQAIEEEFESQYIDMSTIVTNPDEWEFFLENQNFVVYHCSVYIPNSARGGGVVSVAIDKRNETAEVIDVFGRFNSDYIDFMKENGFIN